MDVSAKVSSMRRASLTGRFEAEGRAQEPAGLRKPRVDLLRKEAYS